MLQPEQRYKTETGEIVVHNADPGNRWHIPSWWLFSLGFLVAVQLVQFFLIFLLYHYITNIDHKLSDSIRDSKKEVIQMLNNRQ